MRVFVSVLIGNHNYGRFIHRAIDSVLSQTYRDFELIVVDDGSTDDSRDTIDAYGDRLIKVYKENGGLADALNAGFERSRGQIICLLDSDDFYYPNKLQRTVSLFDEHSDYQFLFHRLDKVDVDEVVTGTEPESSRSQVLDYRTKARFFHAPPTSGTAFRRAVLERLMPIPRRVTQGADNFLKFACMSLFIGYYSGERLGALRLHGANYGSMGMPPGKRALHDASIAMGIHERLPFLTKASDRLMAITFARFLITRPQDPQLKAVIDEYFATTSIASYLKVHLFGCAFFAKRMISGSNRQY